MPTEVKATHVFWQDQAKYYFVCDDCYQAFSHLRWSGETKVSNWETYRRQVYWQLAEGKLCEWCSTENYPLLQVIKTTDSKKPIS